MVIVILPISKKLEDKIKRHNLTKIFQKQLFLLSRDPKYPSLNVELLEPQSYGIYSFRINLKFRALFIFRDDKKTIEVLNITVHYR